MYNITVLDHFFNLTKKSNLIGRLQYELKQFFDNLLVAYFLGHPVGCVAVGCVWLMFIIKKK